MIKGKSDKEKKMGADIHVHLMSRNNNGEDYHAVVLNTPTRVDDDGRSEYLEAYTGRSYQLFGLLAGVRGEQDDELTHVRGLHSGIPAEIQAEYDEGKTDNGCRGGNYFHSATWYTRAELESMLAVLKARYERTQTEYMTRWKYDKEYSYSEMMVDVENSVEYDDYYVFDGFYASLVNYAEVAYDWDFLYHDGVVVMWFDS